ncbi:MAG: peptide chain release factor 2, partial [Candidatus Dadabacteria bacterium]
EEIELLERQASAPGFWDNQETAQKVMKQIERLRAPLERFERIQSALDDAEVMLELAREAGDASALSDAEQIYQAAQQDLDRFEFERLLGDEHDALNALVTVQAGAGGTEAQDWAEMLLRMIIRYAESRGFSVSLLDESPGEEAGIKSATIRVEGDYAYGYLKSESGVHRLVRISPYDANKRRHTSFAAVFVMPEIEDDEEIEIDDKDLRIDTYRSSGAGGQHVNKTDSAVRITHIPTGIVVACQNERSQHQNKATALKLLQARLYELQRAEREQRLEGFHAGKKKIEWGSQIRNYVLQPYQMVKDLRTGYETSNVDAVLNGDLEPFVDAWLRHQAPSDSTAPE